MWRLAGRRGAVVPAGIRQQAAAQTRSDPTPRHPPQQQGGRAHSPGTALPLIIWLLFKGKKFRIYNLQIQASSKSKKNKPVRKYLARKGLDSSYPARHGRNILTPKNHLPLAFGGFGQGLALHSARNASIGLTLAARRAGRYAAAIPLANRNTTAAASVQPSCAFTP